VGAGTGNSAEMLWIDNVFLAMKPTQGTLFIIR